MTENVQPSGTRRQWPRIQSHDEPPTVFERDSDQRQPWYYPSSEEAEESLEIFRTHVTPDLFPFVVVPKTMSAKQLRQRRPLLWKGIMMKGFDKDAARHVPLANELLKDVVACAFFQSRRTLDLLQALQLLAMS